MLHSGTGNSSAVGLHLDFVTAIMQRIAGPSTVGADWEAYKGPFGFEREGVMAGKSIPETGSL